MENTSRRYRLKLAGLVAGLLVLATALIRFFQWLYADANVVSGLKIAPGWFWPLPFECHYVWDFVFVAVVALVSVFLATGPIEAPQAGEDVIEKRVDAAALNIVVGLMAAVLTAALGLAATIIVGFVVGCLRPREVRPSLLSDLVVPAAWGGLVISLVLGMLVGLSTGAAAALVFLVAQLLTLPRHSTVIRPLVLRWWRRLCNHGTPYGLDHAEARRWWRRPCRRRR